MANVALSEMLLAAVKQEAEKINASMRADLARLTPDMDELLIEVLNYGLFNGGKRIRPLLVVVASRLCGRKDEEAYQLGGAFEYLHAATLFHDDIIDQSVTRRGKLSVYQKFGTIAAILAGDFLHALAMATVGRFSGQAGLDVFCRATTGMVDGEFMQLRNTKRHNLSELDYYEAIMGKTGLLISAACEVGALFGGGDVRRVAALREYGVHLGCAYQIIDDLLDYQGDPAKTGKAVGNDLAEGKMTLPLILALNKASSADRTRIMQILGDDVDRSLCIEEVCTLIAKYNGFAAARKKAEDAVAGASAMLAVFTDKNVAFERDLLEGLARYVLTREK
ncbi:polyprenyl synthetase family protein [Desulfopila sp. IMCC35006]|uniref:polyprenyl synthetase family protein n=1 Tax=Desulfopila sp. IMCC35006 TaxID=2569542 RepID=UPI0010AC1E16|nr:polyprenyl synthetase family protein [Desulfopila sp. IMCC35006]TKB23833.1 polyprenyl synthetase family protein [Desulfopila sp. IMCC35006]